MANTKHSYIRPTDAAWVRTQSQEKRFGSGIELMGSYDLNSWCPKIVQKLAISQLNLNKLVHKLINLLGRPLTLKITGKFLDASTFVTIANLRRIHIFQLDTFSILERIQLYVQIYFFNPKIKMLKFPVKKSVITANCTIRTILFDDNGSYWK